jgi:hypothetical protein
VISHGLQRLVAASHCCSLVVIDQQTGERVMERVARAEIHVIALPSTNLVLQGRVDRCPRIRGLIRVKELLDTGVNVAVVSDNVQDPFNPLGTYDLFQIANLAAHAAHMTGGRRAGRVPGDDHDPTGTNPRSSRLWFAGGYARSPHRDGRVPSGGGDSDGAGVSGCFPRWPPNPAHDRAARVVRRVSTPAKHLVLAQPVPPCHHQ